MRDDTLQVTMIAGNRELSLTGVYPVFTSPWRAMVAPQMDALGGRPLAADSPALSSLFFSNHLLLPFDLAFR
jgi:hypothetical protein